MDISRQIAEYVISTESASMPESARAISRLSLIDWIAVAVAGRDEPVSQIVRQMMLEEGGTSQASVIGSDLKLPARAAALSNGTTSHALDYDDTHFIYLGHPGVAVIPAALAMAEKIGDIKLGEFIDACLIGFEVACRVGAWLGRNHYQTGFHITATAGSFGATAAVCRLMGHSIEQTTHALGLVATRSSGIKAQFGTMGKPFHAGMAASNGVEAATLIAAGFISNPDAMSTVQGFGETHSGECNDSMLLDDLGSNYIFETVQHKFHACCHGTHATIEAALEACNRYQLVPENIRQISVTVHPRYLKVCNIAEPKTGLESKFSLRMTTAMAVAGNDTRRLETFSDAACNDSRLCEIRDKVTVSTDVELSETMSRVSFEYLDQNNVEVTHDLKIPLIYQTRELKVRNKAVSLLGEEKAEQTWQIINDANNSVSQLAGSIIQA